MIASGIRVSSNVRPAVISRTSSTIRACPVDPPRPSFIVSATTSAVNVERIATSISAAPIPSAIHVPTIAPMLLPLTQSIR